MKFIYALLISVVPLAAQAGDVWRSNKVELEISQPQKAAGVYRGTMVNQATGKTMGALEVNLSPHFEQGRVGLRGWVSIVTGAVSSSAEADTIYMSANESNDQGKISATLSVPIDDKTPRAIFSLNATLNGDTLSGVIAPIDRSGIEGRFTVVRDAPLPSDQGSVGEDVKFYEGSFADKICDSAKPSYLCRGQNGMINVQMAVDMVPQSSGYAFLNHFVDVRGAGVTLTFGGAVTVTMPTAELNIRTGSLRFLGFLPGSDSTSLVDLECQKTDADSYKCNYSSRSSGLTYSFDLASKK